MKYAAVVVLLLLLITLWIKTGGASQESQAALYPSDLAAHAERLPPLGASDSSIRRVERPSLETRDKASPAVKLESESSPAEDPTTQADAIARLRGLSQAELQKEAVELEKTLNELIEDPLLDFYHRGYYEIVPQNYKATAEEVNTQIIAFFSAPGNQVGMCRVVLPPEEFEELYAMKRNLIWMKTRLSEHGHDDRGDFGDD